MACLLARKTKFWPTSSQSQDSDLLDVTVSPSTHLCARHLSFSSTQLFATSCKHKQSHDGHPPGCFDNATKLEKRRYQHSTIAACFYCPSVRYLEIIGVKYMRMFQKSGKQEVMMILLREEVALKLTSQVSPPFGWHTLKRENIEERVIM